MRKDYFIFLKEIIYGGFYCQNCVLFSRSLSLKDAVFIFHPVNNKWYLYLKNKHQSPQPHFFKYTTK